MRNTILLLAGTLCFSSCYTYQYYTVDSPQLPKDLQQSIVLDNDTMHLAYDFSGAGGDLTITLLNKSNQSIFINWSKSVLIYKNKSYPLAQMAEGFMAAPVRNGVGTQVPPNSKVSQAVLNLNSSVGIGWMVMPDNALQQVARLPHGAKRTYRSAVVTEDQSPVRMKIFLTFDMGPGNGTEFTESHDFYIGKVLQTSYPPEKFPLYQNSGQYFLRKDR